MSEPMAQVAFQGEKGSYSHEACERYFGANVRVRPFRDLRGVFDAVKKRRMAYGLVPVENSYEGSVNETYDLLATASSKVCGEVEVRVRHCLVAKPGAKARDIKIVYSHPQALAQCARYLRAHRLEAIPAYDTAGSVKLIKSMASKRVAAIASRRAAELNSMKVLAEGIEDSGMNYTRFLVLGQKMPPRSGRDKTSILFGVEHRPGSLYGALKVLSDRGINLTRIESRPVKNTPWQYNFYVDFLGHVRDEVSRAALDDLRRRSTFVKVLGSYPAGLPLEAALRTGGINPAQRE